MPSWSTGRKGYQSMSMTFLKSTANSFPWVLVHGNGKRMRKSSKKTRQNEISLIFHLFKFVEVTVWLTYLRELQRTEDCLDCRKFHLLYSNSREILITPRITRYDFSTIPFVPCCPFFLFDTSFVRYFIKGWFQQWDNLSWGLHRIQGKNRLLSQDWR